MDAMQKISSKSPKRMTMLLDIKNAIALAPNVEKLSLFGCGYNISFTSRKEFGNKVLEILKGDTVKTITLSSVTLKGYYGNICNGLKDAQARKLFKGNVSELSFKVYEGNEVKVKQDSFGYGQGRYMGD